MLHRWIAGGRYNTRKDRVSLHKWRGDAQVAKLWTNAVKNTRSDVFNPLTSRLCSAHFKDDSYGEQSVIAKYLGLKMKNILKPNAVSTIFKKWSSTSSETQELLAESMRYFRAKVYFESWRAPGNLFLPNQFQKRSKSVPLIVQKNIFLPNQRRGLAG